MKVARENVDQVMGKKEIVAMKKVLDRFEEETKKLKARLMLLEQHVKEGEQVHLDADKETLNKVSVGETPPLKTSALTDVTTGRERTDPIGLAQVIYTTPHAIFEAARLRRYDLSNEPIRESRQSNVEND